MPREMKESGVDWIGAIPKSWGTEKIGQLYVERKKKVSDKDFPPLSVTMSGIVPQLSTAAKTDAHDDRKLVKKGDFVINSRSDRRGSCGISNYDGSVSLINTVLESKRSCVPEYYEFVFRSSLFADEYYKWGHGIVDDLWTTNWQDMKKILIPIPSPDEQRNIASFLEKKCNEIDKVITDTERSIEEYKKLKQSIITEAVTKGVRGHNREMKNSGIEWIGKIPKEWKVIKVSGAFERKNKKAKQEDPVVLSLARSGVKIRDISNNEGQLAESYYDYNPVNPGDLLLNPMDLVSGANCSISEVTGVISPAYINLGAKEGFNPLYYDYYFKVQYWSGAFFAHGSGVSFDNRWTLSVSVLFQYPLLVPSEAEQNEIATYIKNKSKMIDGLIDTKQKFIDELENYKKSIIYEYVTGKKEVPEQ